MRILITGICGFAGSALAESLLERVEGARICGIDNLIRPGSEGNRGRLRRMGVEFVHGDIRAASDWTQLPACDWVIDAAANPSVLAGVSGPATSRQLFEHNLGAMGNVLEYAKQHGAGLSLLSSSRVYSIPALAALPLRVEGKRFQLDDSRGLPAGVSARGITAEFSTAPPVSLYGATKLAAETMALEYGQAFGFPVWITRCGVLAGAGQFGTPDQGIFTYWINAHLRRRALRFIGFGGAGLQVRDAFHPRDLAGLLLAQMKCSDAAAPRVMTAGGGAENALSLAELHAWCDQRFGAHAAGSGDAPRPYDIPWMVMDNTRAAEAFGWRPETGMAALLEEIAGHAGSHPEWLERSGL
ncbi:MAG: NAD-dependent epimerase/dehydratase family protein [Candidatus Solibacter usitatus]|nr:NAD-dependent epimerase/dehydratase family protein [Candidatus Solibacter usitatus]